MGSSPVVVVSQGEIEADFRRAVKNAIAARALGCMVKCPWDFYYMLYAKQLGLDQSSRLLKRAGQADRDPDDEGSAVFKRFPKLVRVLQGV